MPKPNQSNNEAKLSQKAVTKNDYLSLAGPGFRDFTRIAASDPTMWRDVFLANKAGVLEMLGRFNQDLAKLTSATTRIAVPLRASIRPVAMPAIATTRQTTATRANRTATTRTPSF